MTIVIANGRTTRQGEWCDRRSILGNPFPMTCEAQRDVVCDRYDVWLTARIAAKDEAILAELGRLWRLWQWQGELVLLCWCAPRRCHCESVRRALLTYLPELP